MQKFAAELFGTFFLVLTVGLTGDAVASGFLIMAAVIITGRISGAHFNPAVTLAFWATGSMTGRDFCIYCLNQITGALLGAFAVYFLSGVVDYFTPASYSGPFQYAFAEGAFALILALVYLTLFQTREFAGNKIYAFAIGLTYAGLITTGETISGALFNPAMALGTSLAGLVEVGDPGEYLPIYLLAPLAGGLVAGHFFLYLNKSDGTAGEA